MLTYSAPLRDMRFVYEELLQGGELQSLPGMEDVSPELLGAVLEEAARFCEKVLLPLNQSGDQEGCRFENGQVFTPKGYREAYRQYMEGGWPSLSCDPAYGGQGLPHMLHCMVGEMICSTNLSFAIYSELTHGVYELLHQYGTDELKSLYLPPLAEGRWSGTMCLTEPQCGTDLGLIRTRAVLQEDGSYQLNGGKIFISAGEHDLTENIIHMVLARTPDAPPGTKGISLFLVPKIVPQADGAPGPANGVECVSIEHKMGIRASSTCTLSFNNAKGWLIGKENQGLRAMFLMMNRARLWVGLQGLGLAETGYQNAVHYARERLQGRALKGPVKPDKPADPIIVHPDVRRMLLTMRAYNEGMRAMSVWAAARLDHSERQTDRKTRQEAEDFIALITPVIKAFFTDLGFEATNLAIQVYGGHGYITENGIEQLVRDARIGQLYEGTNGIQALDLIGRKLPAHAGRHLRTFFQPLEAYLNKRRNHPHLAPMVGAVAKAFGRLQRASVQIALKGMQDPDEGAAVAYDYLQLFGLVALGWMWLRMSETALAKLENDPQGFYKAKIATARFYMEKILPRSGSLFSSIMAGAPAITEFETDRF